jgi:hypothetical protein
MHDPTDPVGRLLSNVLAVVAEFEADLISLRTRAPDARARVVVQRPRFAHGSRSLRASGVIRASWACLDTGAPLVGARTDPGTTGPVARGVEWLGDAHHPSFRAMLKLIK